MHLMHKAVACACVRVCLLASGCQTTQCDVSDSRRPPRSYQLGSETLRQEQAMACCLCLQAPDQTHPRALPGPLQVLQDSDLRATVCMPDVLPVCAIMHRCSMTPLVVGPPPYGMPWPAIAARGALQGCRAIGHHPDVSPHLPGHTHTAGDDHA